MKKLASRAVSALTNNAQELMLVLGLGLVGYGAGSVYLPAGFFLPGAVITYVAIFGMR